LWRSIEVTLPADTKRTVKLMLAYDGTAYAGWQAQDAQTTVQGVLEAALARVTGETMRVVASGRTDAGVHALAQVVSFSTASILPAEVLQQALNAELPHDVSVLAAADVRPGFHAIRDAVRKRYRYLIDDGRVPDVFRRKFAWYYRFAQLDAAAMHRAAQAWLGRHDFKSFQSHGSERKSTVRTVFEMSVARPYPDAPHVLAVEVEADGFLYNMVRAMVGTLVEVGRRTQPERWAAEVLAACDRRAAGMTAPAHGLFLVRVHYPPDGDGPGGGHLVP
jgi:tRNA pseudouridine38-40 synthase